MFAPLASQLSPAVAEERSPTWRVLANSSASSRSQPRSCQCQKLGGDLASLLVGKVFAEGLESSAVFLTRKELVAINEAAERRRLLAQGMDDVVVVDDLVMPPVCMAASAAQRSSDAYRRQRHPVGSSNKRTRNLAIFGGLHTPMTSGSSVGATKNRFGRHLTLVDLLENALIFPCCLGPVKAPVSPAQGRA